MIRIIFYKENRKKNHAVSLHVMCARLGVNFSAPSFSINQFTIWHEEESALCLQYLKIGLFSVLTCLHYRLLTLLSLKTLYRPVIFLIQIKDLPD